MLSTLPASTSLGYLPTTHSPVIPKLAFFNSVTGDGSKIPNYRVLDELGVPVEGAEVPQLSKQFAWRLYENMQLLSTLDDILCSGQRQGRIPFYATSYGEEATVIGSAAALADDDEHSTAKQGCSYGVDSLLTVSWRKLLETMKILAKAAR